VIGGLLLFVEFEALLDRLGEILGTGGLSDAECPVGAGNGIRESTGRGVDSCQGLQYRGVLITRQQPRLRTAHTAEW